MLYSRRERQMTLCKEIKNLNVILGECKTGSEERNIKQIATAPPPSFQPEIGKIPEELTYLPQ